MKTILPLKRKLSIAKILLITTISIGISQGQIQDTFVMTGGKRIVGTVIRQNFKSYMVRVGIEKQKLKKDDIEYRISCNISEEMKGGLKIFRSPLKSIGVSSDINPDSVYCQISKIDSMYGFMVIGDFFFGNIDHEESRVLLEFEDGEVLSFYHMGNTKLTFSRFDRFVCAFYNDKLYFTSPELKRKEQRDKNEKLLQKIEKISQLDYSDPKALQSALDSIESGSTGVNKQETKPVVTHEMHLNQQDVILEKLRKHKITSMTLINGSTGREEVFILTKEGQNFFKANLPCLAKLN